jgi:hypothetical protein
MKWKIVKKKMKKNEKKNMKGSVEITFLLKRGHPSYRLFFSKEAIPLIDCSSQKRPSLL